MTSTDLKKLGWDDYCNLLESKHQAAIAALQQEIETLRALQQHAGEVTDEMKQAACKAVDREHSNFSSRGYFDADMAETVYKAMLAAVENGETKP